LIKSKLKSIKKATAYFAPLIPDFKSDSERKKYMKSLNAWLKKHNPK